MSKAMNQLSEAQHTSKFTLGKLKFRWRQTTPVILQSEASECGLACLAMIANYHGHEVSLRELRKCMPASQQGMNLQEIIQNASTLGLSSRALKADLSDLPDLQMPAILHWNFKHFVVLTKVTKNYVYIIDPAAGKQKLSLHKVDKLFTGIALELRPNRDFLKAKQQGRLSLWEFAKNKVGIKRHICILLLLSLFIQVFVLASPFYMQTIIDNVLLSNNQDLLAILALGFALLLLFETCTQWLRDFIMLRFSNVFNLSISSGVFAHLLSLPSAFFQTRHIGDIVSRFGSLQQVRDILTQGLLSAFLDGLLGLVTLIVMFVYSTKLAFIVLAVVALYSLLRWVLFYPVQQLNQQILHSDAEQQSYFMQSVRAITTIKLANASEKTHATWLNKFIDNANQRISLGKWHIHFSIINKLLFGLENIIVVYVAAQLVMNNHFSVGMLFAFMSYKSRFVSSTARLIDQWIEFKLLGVHLSRLEDILFCESEASPALNDKLAQASQQTLNNLHIDDKNKAATMRIDNISFSYHPQHPPIFNKLSLTIDSGEFIAVAGQSGCGKTSFLNCILGLIAPSEGTITINKQNLQAANRHFFSLAAVMQSDQLLNGSVLDNISNFDERIDLARAVRAAEVACIHQDIMAMTMQYETLIGDMGDSLSGGQKQRIILARAIYQQPAILVLDEATSHLDINTEARICEQLKTLPTTIIMVAHRPQALAAANKIYTLSSHGLTENSYSSDSASTPEAIMLSDTTQKQGS